VHDDFWPGNTIWSRQRLTGVVDWGEAKIGDPRLDVGQCRVDLAMMLGPDAADAFLRAYAATTGDELSSMWFWDLYSARGALPAIHYWLDGYHDLGLTDLTLTAMRQRLEDFVKRALAAVPR
jgi:aminoglycoside phosphotransferase (APT) family kinase protein